uniref:Toprim domain-containing protein n=1 Tax=Panagrolaimus sp. ES5 TaxID=591445 RepID=A0AC34GE33_9BILA
MYGKTANIIVTSTNGHLKGETVREKNVKENEFEDIEEILYAKIFSKPSDNKEYFEEMLQNFGVNWDRVLLMLDYDEEGEAIAFGCINYLLDFVSVSPSGHKMDAFCR